MTIKRVIVGPVETNCYFLKNDETGETVIFDPGDSPDYLISYMEENGMKPCAICLTHGHYDHILGIAGVLERYHIPVYAAESEKALLADGELNHSAVHYKDAVTVNPDHLLKDGEAVKLAGAEIKTLFTPGHTEGSCCYYIAEMHLLLSGDTLFEGSVGRTDLPTGSMSRMMHSINDVLKKLPDDTDVYPGHGGFTTIGDEKQWNPYFTK